MNEVSNGHGSRALHIGKWLQSLGIPLSSPYALEGTIVPEFSNGLLLCQLVSTLELQEITGITKQPKSKAASLHNIRKALEVLRTKKNMPLEYLWSELEIFQGLPEVICGLLEHVRKAYAQKTNTFTMAQSRSSSVTRSNTPQRPGSRTPSGKSGIIS
jgi:hypothetical protein